MARRADEDDRWRDSPTAWFAILERARGAGDEEIAEEARTELARLGVIVTFIKGVVHA